MKNSYWNEWLIGGKRRDFFWTSELRHNLCSECKCTQTELQVRSECKCTGKALESQRAEERKLGTHDYSSSAKMKMVAVIICFGLWPLPQFPKGFLNRNWKIFIAFNEWIVWKMTNISSVFRLFEPIIWDPSHFEIKDLKNIHISLLFLLYKPSGI